MTNYQHMIIKAAELHSSVVTSWLALPIPKQVIFWCPPAEEPGKVPILLDFDASFAHEAYYGKSFLEIDFTLAPFETMFAPVSQLTPEAALYYLGSFLKYGLIQVMCLGNFSLGRHSKAFISLNSLLTGAYSWESLIENYQNLFECIFDVTNFLYSCPVEISGLRHRGPVEINSIWHYMQTLSTRPFQGDAGMQALYPPITATEMAERHRVFHEQVAKSKNRENL